MVRSEFPMDDGRRTGWYDDGSSISDRWWTGQEWLDLYAFEPLSGRRGKPLPAVFVPHDLVVRADEPEEITPSPGG